PALGAQAGRDGLPEQALLARAVARCRSAIRVGNCLMSTPTAAPAAWDLGDALWALQAAAPPARDRCLLCTVGRTRLALPMAQLRGVEPYETVTPVPHVPAWVLGVTNV